MAPRLTNVFLRLPLRLAAAVRARALGHVAEVIESFTRLMQAGAAAAEEEGDAEGLRAGAASRCFLMALCGSRQLRMQVGRGTLNDMFV